MNKVTYYPPIEEKINIITHALGIVLSIIATVLLVIRASLYGDVWHIVSFSLFGASMITLYTASTAYHSAREKKVRHRLNVFDHSAIYVLIAGTYTPFTLVTLNGVTGWVIFGLTWGFAVAGIILKLFYAGKYNLISTIMYVLLGWMIIFAVKPLINNLPVPGLFWLLGGGIAYTIGAVLYSIRKLSYNHAIFHVLVLVGTFCHFIAVYFYVLVLDS